MLATVIYHLQKCHYGSIKSIKGYNHLLDNHVSTWLMYFIRRKGHIVNAQHHVNYLCVLCVHDFICLGIQMHLFAHFMSLDYCITLSNEMQH